MSINRILKTGLVALFSLLMLGILGASGFGLAFGRVLAQTYQPPENVTVIMYRLLNDGSRSTERCDLFRNGQYVNLYSWGCTAYCEGLSLCDTSKQLPYPMVAEPAALEIDGTSGSSGEIYNQYLRDVIPLEIGVKLGSQGYKTAAAVEAQAIAARTYIYQRIYYASQYGTPNNSNQFQVFVPYYYDTFNLSAKSHGPDRHEQPSLLE